MSINFSAVRNAVRARVISSSGIDPITQFFPQNVECNPSGLSLFVREFSIGGAEYMVSPVRSRIPSFLIQYDFFAPTNKGMDDIETAVSAVLAEFDLADKTKSNVDVSGMNVVVKNINRKAEEGKEYHREILLFTLDVTS